MNTRIFRQISSLGAAALVVLLTAATPPESPIADAAMKGNVEQVKSLIRDGLDVNMAQGDGMTALHWAARKGDVELVDFLVSAGANVAAVTRLGDYTPLLVAMRAGHEGAALSLVRAGASVTATTSTGVTPLHFAAQGGSVKVIEAMLAAGADIEAKESASSQTPLMFAASFGRTDAVRYLISRGAEVNVRTPRVDLPAVEAEDRAAQRQRTVAMRERNMTPEERAAAAAADSAREADRAQQGPQPGGGGTAPAQPAAQGQAAAGAIPEGDPDRPLSYSELVGGIGGMTPFLHAVRQGHMETALALLDEGADVNDQMGGDNASAMLMATMNGHWDLAVKLLERGANPNVASDAGSTPLYAAINLYWAPKALYPQPKNFEFQEIDFLDFLETLLKNGADPNVRLDKHLWYMSYNFDLLGVDTGGASPFWRAAYALDIPVMKLLLQYGADPEIPTRKGPERRRGPAIDEDPSGLEVIPVGGPGVYPIHAASGVGYGLDFAGNAHRYVPDGWLPTVKFLVEEVGADVNVRDHMGYSALHHAASRGDVELIQYLVDQGADVMAVSRRGQTTADLANGPVQRVEPYPEAIKLLESLGSKNNNNCLSC